MQFSWQRPGWLIASVCCVSGSLFAQTPVKPPAVSSKIEPGLDVAVNWIWSVAPSDKKEWGMPVPEALRPKSPDALEEATVEERPEIYVVQKGDAIIKIAKKFDMTAAQLKLFNELKGDRIQIGQELRIPSMEQVLSMIPPPPAVPAPKPEEIWKTEANASAGVPDMSDPDYEARLELENVRVQVFLDREMFSPGLIDGKPGATFQKISEIYQRSHPDAADAARLKVKAEAMVTQPYTNYALTADDFKFIKPPKVESKVAPVGKSPAARKKGGKSSAAAPPPPPVTIDELVAADFLCYANPWEFIAERFHCDEAFLRRINPQLKGDPTVGASFQVPNVIPFEIEKALDAPLQPTADPKKPITAAIVLLSRLEIFEDGRLIAVMPLATARPGLRGRDKWTVLDVIPQPRLATKREPRDPPKPTPPAVPGEVPIAKPVIAPPLEKEQYLASGPNNPLGILWINLAKAGSTEPLPYGLHGTSIPARLKVEGLGGLRLANWDIARAMRLMPVGTVLQWKAQ
jgi:LysM repeat protein/lipoprotein-anchoring transpeptidase ErfK/SrfK